MASNTGCTSDGELAITFRISAVAVCRSSASLGLVEQATFSIAITAWSAKVWSRASCLSEKANPVCGWVTMMVPMPRLSWISGTKVMLPKPPAAEILLVYSGVSGACVWGIAICPALQDGACRG